MADQSIMEFFMTTLAGGVIYDVVKSGMQVTGEYLKGQIRNISLTDDEISFLESEINKRNGKVEVLENKDIFIKDMAETKLIRNLHEKYRANIGVQQIVNGDNNRVAGRDYIEKHIYKTEEKKIKKY